MLKCACANVEQPRKYRLSHQRLHSLIDGFRAVDSQEEIASVRAMGIVLHESESGFEFQVNERIWLPWLEEYLLDPENVEISTTNLSKNNNNHVELVHGVETPGQIAVTSECSPREQKGGTLI